MVQSREMVNKIRNSDIRKKKRELGFPMVFIQGFRNCELFKDRSTRDINNKL